MKRQKENINYNFGEVCEEKTKSIRTGEHVRATEEETQVENDLEAVIHQTMSWLTLLNPEHRPKSKEKLYNSLSKICFSTYVVDSQIIYYHLIMNGFIFPSGEGSNAKITFNPKDTSVCRIAYPDDPLFDGMKPTVSTDFAKTLKKAIAWVTSNRGFHDKTMLMSSFMPSLIQLCIIKKNVDPLKVIEHFQYKGLISVDSNSGLLEYHLPTQEMRPCHYMSSPFPEEEFENSNFEIEMI